MGNLLLGFDKPCARRRLHIDDELARIGSGKEGEFQTREQQQACGEPHSKKDQPKRWPPQHHADQRVVNSEEPTETTIEPGIEPLPHAESALMAGSFSF